MKKPKYRVGDKVYVHFDGPKKPHDGVVREILTVEHPYYSDQVWVYRVKGLRGARSERNLKPVDGYKLSINIARKWKRLLRRIKSD